MYNSIYAPRLCGIAATLSQGELFWGGDGRINHTI